MAAKKSSRGSFVIAAAIVFAALLIAVTLFALLRKPAPTPSPRPKTTPAGRVTKAPKAPPVAGGFTLPGKDPFSPIPEPTPSPPTKSPQPQPTSTDDDLIRDRVLREARHDRPGDVLKVVNVRITHTDRQTCASKLAASANARYSMDPKIGVWFLCKSGDKWVITSGPLYGE